MRDTRTTHVPGARKWRWMLWIHAAVWGLSACGGGGGDAAVAVAESSTELQAPSPSPSTQAPTPQTENSADTVHFGVLGDLPVMADGSVPQETLDGLGLSAQRLEEIRVSQYTGAPSLLSSDPVDRMQALGTGSYDIIDTWNDRMGHQIVLRRGYYSGDSGFGWTKIVQKHNLTTKAVWAATAGPPTRTFVAGSKYDYFAPVFHVKCSGWWIFRTCRVTEQTTIKTGVDFRTVNDGKAFGVVTSFCLGHDGACPDWVKNAINI